MNDRDRRLASLAAVFAPRRAAALLARLVASPGSDVAAHAARLADLPRPERLRALTESIAVDPAALRRSAEAAASVERAPVATVLRALGGDAVHTGAAPIVARLCRERIAH